MAEPSEVFASSTEKDNDTTYRVSQLCRENLKDAANSASALCCVLSPSSAGK